MPSRESERRAELARLLARGMELRTQAAALMREGTPFDPTAHLALRRDLLAYRRELASFRAIFGRTRRPKKDMPGF